MGIRLTALEVNYPYVRADVFDLVNDACMLPGEYVYRDTHVSQGRRQLSNVDVHASRLALSGRCQWARVESDKCRSFHAQLLVTTI